VWLDPVLLARALAARADPRWVGTEGFTVAVRLAGTVGASFTVTTAGGVAVRPGPPGPTSDATVSTTTLAFYRWLSGEAIDVPVAVDGDPDAVKALVRLAERAVES
jgi:hypothetical protein